MELKYYIIKRLLLAIPTLLGILLIVFLLTHVVPGDPVAFIAGRYAGPETKEKITREYGLDKPLQTQFIIYLFKIFQGNLGKSLVTRNPVTYDISIHMPVTIELIMFSFGLVVLLGVTLGVISAIYRDKPIDHFTRVFSLGGLSIPGFYLAILLILVVAYNLHILPTGGRIDYGIGLPPRITGLYTIDSILTGNWPALVSAIKHLILPALSLTYSNSAILMRMTRSVMVESLMEDYVTTAKVYGFPSRYINYIYALKPAIAPSVTVMGMNLGFMMSGAFIIETIFSFPGIGKYTAQAVESLDYQAIMGVTLFFGTIFVLINLVVDIIYAYLDPRVKY